LTGDSALTKAGVSVGELSYWNEDSETTLGNAGTYTVKTTVTLPSGTTLSGASYADASNNTVVLAVTGSITKDSDGTELHNHTNVELHYTSSTSGTLTELFNTAPTDGCVAKVVLDKDYVGEGSVTVNSNRNIILDLNGHKIERTDDGSAIIVGRWGTLRIVNSQSTMGYITSTGEGYSGIYNRGALTIDSSNVKVKAGYGITTYLDSSNGCSDVSVTVTAGIIEGSVSGIYVQQASGTAGAQTTAITISGENTSIEGINGSGIILSQYISGATTLTVKDGAKITGKEYAIFNYSSFYTGSKYEITGGTLTAANAVYRYYYTSNVEITGGTFVFTGINQNSAYSAVESTLSGTLTKYLGEGYVLVQNTAGDNSMSYHVTTESANYVAGTNLIDYVTKEVKATNKFDLQVGKWGFVVDDSSNPIAAMYKSITAAYSDASHTITLVDDIENGFFDIQYSGDFTIDLGTHTLNYDATKEKQKNAYMEARIIRGRTPAGLASLWHAVT
jgi:hypothetical protein